MEFGHGVQCVFLSICLTDGQEFDNTIEVFKRAASLPMSYWRGNEIVLAPTIENETLNKTNKIA